MYFYHSKHGRLDIDCGHSEKTDSGSREEMDTTAKDMDSLRKWFREMVLVAFLCTICINKRRLFGGGRNQIYSYS